MKRGEKSERESEGKKESGSIGDRTLVGVHGGRRGGVAEVNAVAQKADVATLSAH